MKTIALTDGDFKIIESVLTDARDYLESEHSRQIDQYDAFVERLYASLETLTITLTTNDFYMLLQSILIPALHMQNRFDTEKQRDLYRDFIERVVDNTK